MSETEPTYEQLLAAKAQGMIAVCGRCKVPLNTLTDTITGEVTFLHSQAYRNHDHEPVPTLVDRTGGEAASDCDFCGTRRQLHWSFLGKRVEIDHPQLRDGELGKMATNDYGDRWAACKECGEAINAEDYAELMRLCKTRSPVARRTLKEGPEAEEVLLQSFSLLWGQYLPSIYQRDYIGPLTPATRLNPRMMPKIQVGLMNFWGDVAYRIALLKEHKDVYAIPGVHTGDEDTFSVTFAPGNPVPPPVWKNHFDHLKAGIGASSRDCYWIAPNFTQLAIMAGKDFETLSITREQLPSPFGLMVFEEPIGEIKGLFGPAHVRAVSWTLVPGGIWVNMYIQPEQNAPSNYDVLDGRARNGYLMPINYGAGLQFGEQIEVSADRDDGNPDFVATILAAWFLLAQPGVAEISIAPVDKKLARAYQRQYGRKLDDVLIVDLRKPPVRSHGSRGTGPRGPLTVRVYRRGHWKQQAYGVKRGLRKTIYVSPYIAGPENAPLKDTRATVRVLR